MCATMAGWVLLCVTGLPFWQVGVIVARVLVFRVSGFQGASHVMSAAKKLHPAKWEQAKARAKAKMGGKHSARAMQLAVKYYKDAGGKYSGPKKKTSLGKWTKQDWQWSKGDKGVYLPKEKISRLKSTPAGKKKLRKAAEVKARATRKGRQYSRHGLAAGTS